MEYRLEDLNVNELIQELGLLARLIFRQSDIRLEIQLAEDLPPIRGNKEKLKQAVLNFITNAHEATPPGGLIRLKTKRIINNRLDDSEYVQIEISNTGTGIKDDDLKKIFEPFYSTKSDSLGLGLPISKDIIDYHNGYIEVMNDGNNTTFFLIKLPAKLKNKLKTAYSPSPY
jgi:signal transduction histidine kinase